MGSELRMPRVRFRHGKNGNANLNQRKRRKIMKTLPVLLIGLVACIALGVSTTRGQQYSLEDLGVVKGMEASDTAAINNQGHVAGTAYKGEQTCAFHYDYFKKIMEDAGGLNSRGFGINSGNIVVGDALFPGRMIDGSHAAMFKGGVAVDLGLLKGQTFSRANGINTIGQIVGYSGRSRDGTNSRAFLWNGVTGMLDIGTLGGAYAQAHAINDAGYITGTSQVGASAATTHAFLYCPQCAGSRAMTDLGVLGGYSSYGMAINNYNHVVGYSTIKPNDQRVHAFLHDGRSMIDLGSLGGSASRWGGDISVAMGINNIDQVVGYTYLPAVSGMPVQQVAFRWMRTRNESGIGNMVNLNTLVDKTGRNYLLFSATGINDKGQIAASAYDMRTGSVRAVLLTPLY
jgi:probable HAF family extracellular repeat protein